MFLLIDRSYPYTLLRDSTTRFGLSTMGHPPAFPTGLPEAIAQGHL
jgi:hypothetical protein